MTQIKYLCDWLIEGSNVFYFNEPAVDADYIIIKSLLDIDTHSHVRKAIFIEKNE